MVYHDKVLDIITQLILDGGTAVKTEDSFKVLSSMNDVYYMDTSGYLHSESLSSHRVLSKSTNEWVKI